MSKLIESNWLELGPLSPGPNSELSKHAFMVYQDVSVQITHKVFRVGKQVGEDTGRYRYFIEQGDGGEEGRAYGEWHNERQ